MPASHHQRLRLALSASAYSLSSAQFACSGAWPVPSETKNANFLTLAQEKSYCDLV